MNKDYLRRGLSYLILFLTPAICYLMFETVTGNLLTISGENAIWNLLFFYSFYLLLFVLTNSVRFSYIALNSIFTIWAVAEYLVVGFRARPIMLWDIIAWQTAMTVAGNYSYELPVRVVAAILMMVVLSVLSWFFAYRMSGKRRRLIALGTTLAGVSVWFLLFYNWLISAHQIGINMWDPNGSYQVHGYMVCTMRMFSYMKVEKPDDYSINTLEQIRAEILAADAAQGDEDVANDRVIPTNIICIMNESWSNLSVVAPFETSQDYFSFYHSLSENCVKGNAYVPVFGSMTSNSEYEFLTGHSMAFAPEGSVPYQIYLRKPTYSLPLILKSQGYRTVAMHPYPGQNWNRIEAYQDMGFDEFLDEQYFADSQRIRGYVSDKANYDKIITQTAGKEAGEPLFIFNVTMQNHGGYDQEYEADVLVQEEGSYPLTEQYLSLIKESDQALQYLLEYYESIEEPTLIMMFGDHQPSVEEEFYEMLYGAELSSLKPEDYLRRYITPFFIWTNYETPAQEVDQLSVMFLSNLVLQRAHLKMTEYQQFLEVLRESSPVIHMLGYYNGQGEWESWTKWESKKEYPRFHQLELLQYHAMFDKKRAMGSLFTNLTTTRKQQ